MKAGDEELGAGGKLRGEESQVRPGGGRKCPQRCSGQQDWRMITCSLFPLHRSPGASPPSAPKKRNTQQTRGGCQSLSPVQLCDPMDCSQLGSSVHRISQAGILEWVAISFFRGSSRPWD